MARAIWKGSVNFGLVTVPVQLVPAVRDHDIHFHLLAAADHCRLRRRLVCEDDEREVPYSKTVRGFEIAPDQYVVVEKDELEKLKPESQRAIAITDFVELGQIDPLHFDRPYYLIPDEGGTHAYRLLVAALTQTNRVGVASFVMREKQYLALLRPLGGLLSLSTMRFADELVPRSGLVPSEKGKLPQREQEAAVQLIEALSTTFHPERYEDEYRARVLELIEQKSKGKTPRLSGTRTPQRRVINIMDALKASLAETGRAAGGKRSAHGRRGPKAKRRAS